MQVIFTIVKFNENDNHKLEIWMSITTFIINIILEGIATE